MKKTHAGGEKFVLISRRARARIVRAQIGVLIRTNTAAVMADMPKGWPTYVMKYRLAKSLSKHNKTNILSAKGESV